MKLINNQNLFNTHHINYLYKITCTNKKNLYNFKK